MDKPTAPSRLAARLGWFVFLWLVSIAALGSVAFLIRFWLKV